MEMIIQSERGYGMSMFIIYTFLYKYLEEVNE